MALHADLIGIGRHATNEVVAVLRLNEDHLGEILWYPGQFFVGRDQLPPKTWTRVAVAVGRALQRTDRGTRESHQVIFIEVKHGNYFVGSVPPDTDQISVEGHLRTGRSVEAKRSLIERIVEAVAQAAAMPKSHVWAHLVDMPATQIVEFGRVVPEPGGEAAWIAALPEAERKGIEAIGRVRPAR